ncbi:unnamed protein product, partial [Iphiclides podalirius]
MFRGSVEGAVRDSSLRLLPRCRAYAVKCYRCEKIGHFAKCCRVKFARELQDAGSDDKGYEDYGEDSEADNDNWIGLTEPKSSIDGGFRRTGRATNALSINIAVLPTLIDIPQPSAKSPRRTGRIFGNQYRTRTLTSHPRAFTLDPQLPLVILAPSRSHPLRRVSSPLARLAVHDPIRRVDPGILTELHSTTRYTN